MFITYLAVFGAIIVFFVLGEFVYAEHLNSNLHSVPVNDSYRCNSQENIEMDVQELDNPATVQMSHLQMEAFRNSATDKFSSGT